MVNASMIMGGQRAFDVNLRRHREGIKVEVKIASEMEAFFEQWGGGGQEGLSHGLSWKGVSGEKLTFWTFETTMPRVDVPETYSLFNTGASLLLGDGMVNLSFIRLVGASTGREFICDCVMSRNELERVAAKMRRAAELFYTEFIQPVHLNVFVGVRDVLRDSSI